MPISESNPTRNRIKGEAEDSSLGENNCDSLQQQVINSRCVKGASGEEKRKHGFRMLKLRNCGVQARNVQQAVGIHRARIWE